jgi:hypothetical protein
MHYRLIAVACVSGFLVSCAAFVEPGGVAEKRVVIVERHAAAPLSEDLTTVQETPPWRNVLKERLSGRYTLEFAGEHLPAALNRLAGTGKINVVLDALARVKYGSVPVAFKAEDMSLRRILSRVLENTGLIYDFIGFTVFVGEPRQCSDAKRREAEDEGTRAGANLSEAERATRRLLARPVCFEMCDTPLEEALHFLESVEGVPMDIDPQAVEYGDVPVNVTILAAVPLETALRWILHLGGLEYEIRGDRVFIGTPDGPGDSR